VGEVQTNGGKAPIAAEVADRRVRLASPRTAVILGALTLALVVLYVPLAYPARDFSDGVQVLVAFLALSVPGVVVARRQPNNPVGWLLIGVGLWLAFSTDIGRYAVLDYHFHHGALPLGPPVVLMTSALWIGLFLALPLVILLFPDGRLSRRWRIVLWAYFAVAALTVAYFVGVTAWEMIGKPISVDGSGGLSNANGPSGVVPIVVFVALLASVPLFWLSFVACQILSWRRATGERRQQLKWLMGGAAISVIGLLVTVILGNNTGPIANAVQPISFLAIFALPVSIGVGILKFRLYEIDRLISRTLAYAIVTGLVVGVYVAVITLVTRVLGFSSPVAVAASTLAAVALFNPLRVRIQRVVDRRFNRARYDSEATVAAFTARLRDAVDLETVRSELLEVVNQAVEPAHASVWIRRRQSE